MKKNLNLGIIFNKNIVDLLNNLKEQDSFYTYKSCASDCLQGKAVLPPPTRLGYCVWAISFFPTSCFPVLRDYILQLVSPR